MINLGDKCPKKLGCGGEGIEMQERPLLGEEEIWTRLILLLHPGLQWSSSRDGFSPRSSVLFG